MRDEQLKQVILFDGVCNLCNGMVQFVIKHDKNNLFEFASLQSAYGQRFLQQANLPTHHFSSFILVKNGRRYIKSTAALLVAKELNRAWPLLSILIIIPPFIRNSVYNFIAANRYKWFGKKETCPLPTPELSKRFRD